MSEVKFPYQGWVLTPGFKPVEKTFTDRSESYEYWHYDETGKGYNKNDIHKDKASAIAWGRGNLKVQQAALDKKQENIEKRRAALDKASA
ncbi:hypothetical protein [Delftia acidovorans]|uniref:hypothetical protein n=1 Tax=Delftia acidovorans TaxID=80866 RepID=UPI003017780A